MKKFFAAIFVVCIGAVANALPPPPVEGPVEIAEAQKAINAFYNGEISIHEALARSRHRIEIVDLAGSVFHLGLDLTQNPPATWPFPTGIEGVSVSIAELPATKNLGVQTQEDGSWTLPLLKLKSKPFKASIVYEKAGYPVAKSQIFEINHCDLLDIAAQYPTAIYFGLLKSSMEQQLSAAFGQPYTINNVAVATVGKSWASMYVKSLPHGDPGATVSISPSIQIPYSLGPIYFNEDVIPDPTLTSTSVDGGVLFINLPNGEYTFSATKAPYTYSTVTFAIDSNVGVYVASPPHSMEGTNSSGPGEQ